MIARTKLATAMIAGVVLSWSGLAANALTYTTLGAPTQSSLGDTIGSTYDQLQIQGVTGSLDLNTTSIVLNNLTFIAGVNATVPATYNSGQFSFSETVQIDTGSGGPSGSETLTVPFNLTISYSDTLTVVGGTTISIPVGSNIWNIVVSSLTIGPNPGGPITEALTARVSDPPSPTPLPAAFLLFGSGLGAMELVRRRKKARETASSGA